MLVGFFVGVRSLRWVLLVSLCSAGAALLVALVVGSTTNADSSSAPGTPTVASPTQEQVPAGDDEVVGLRTEQSKTFRRDDGSLTTRVYPEAVHYQDGGSWREIDNALVSGDSGYVHRRANDGDAQIPSSLDDPLRFSHDGDSLSIQMQDADATASVDGDHATFAGVDDGVDAEYQAINGGLREQLTLADASARSAFTYKIRAGAGLSPTDEADGSITFRNADGAVAFRLGAPVVWDSAQPAAVSHATTLHIAAAADGDGWTLTLAVDHDWLTSPDRTFPVTVDPDVYWSDSGLRFHGAQLDCTLADGSSAATSLCADPTLRVGHDASHNYRSNLYFNVRSAIPQDAVIYDATLSLFDPGTAAQSSSNLRVRALSAGWTGAATWNTRDGSTSWTTPGGDLAGAPGIATSVGHQGYWYYFDVPTEAIQSWAWGDSPDNGIQLAADAGAPQQVYSFVSTEGNQAQWPAVDIDWEDPRGLDGPYTNDSQALSDHSQLAVNVANGGLTYTERDASLSASGADDVRVTRSWRSAMASGWGHYGRGWYDGATISSLWPEDDGSVNWVSPGGSSFRFTPGTGNSYNSPPDAPNLTLCKTSWSGCSSSGFSNLPYRLTDTTTNTSYLFYDTGQQRAQVDSHGNVVNTVQTSTSTTVSATGSRTITQPNNGNGMAASTSDGSHTWLYGYSGSDGTVLSSATASGSGGGITQYTYTNNLLTRITDPSGRQTAISWETPATGNPRVTKIVRVLDAAHPTDATKNPTTTYTYNTATRTTVVTDPAGNATATPTDDGQTTYTYDKYEHVTTASPKTSALAASPTWAASDANWDTTRPTSTPSGDLYNDGLYVDGQGTTNIALGATDPAGTDGSISGIRRVALEEGDNANQPAASQPTCSDPTAPPRTCPADVNPTVALDEATLSEGTHHFRQVTQDLAGNTSVSAAWAVLVDRTGPLPPNDFTSSFDGDSQSAEVAWNPTDDPALPGGAPGSGFQGSRYRYQIGSGAFSGWADTEDQTATVPSVSATTVITVQVQARDKVGNLSIVVTATVTAGSTVNESAGVQMDAALSYQAEYGGSLATALTWMATEDRAVDVDPDVEVVGQHLGIQGVWADNDNRRVKVGVSSDADLPAINSMLADRNVAGQTDIVAAVATANELDDAQHQIADEIADLIDGGLVLLGEDSSVGLTLDIAAPATAAQEQRVRDAAAGVSVPTVVTRTARTTYSAHASACYRTYIAGVSENSADKYDACDYPIRGGTVIESNTSEQCSAGFNATDHRGNYYVITAGHCFNSDPASTWGAIHADGGSAAFLGAMSRHTLGHGGDFGAIAVDDSLTPMKPWIFVPRSTTGSTTRDAHYAINGGSYVKPHWTLCIDGSRTGAHCGRVVRRKADVHLTGGNVTVNLLGLIHICGSKRGDSGGPVFKGHRAFGIISAGDDDTCDVFYQNILDALKPNALNLGLVG
jgi:YD repeat-containing protein